jgi:hypothetical protein
VLDAAARTLKWGYSGGFGSTMALGDVDADGKPEIVGAGWQVLIVNGDTMATTSFERAADTVAVGDGNNDGVAEIVTGDGQYDVIRGWSTTGTELWHINSPEHGVGGIGIGDPDGDGANEAVWGAGLSSSGPDRVLVGSPATQTIEWASPDLDGPVYSTAADLDGDGDVELLVGYASTNNNGSGAIVQIQDLHGVVEATLPVPYGPLTRLTTGQLDADPALEVLAVTGNWSGSRLHSFDGVTHALEWASPEPHWETGISGITPVIVANLDGDAVSEIVVATIDQRVTVLNGASNFVQGATAALDGTVYDAALADVNGDATPDLVVGTYNGIYVLKATDLTQQHHTSLTGPKHVAARAGEYAILDGNQVITYAGATNTERWRCTSTQASALRARYVTLGGAPWLAVGRPFAFELYPAGGNACPAGMTLEHPLLDLVDFDFIDVGGDSTQELVLSTLTSAEVDLVSLSTDPRGDADGDGQVLDSDLDALSAHFFGDGRLPRAGADANGDSSLHPEDLFYLINYRRGTGAPPP